MRAGDGVIGALAVCLGLALTLGGWSLPNLPNQSYGAATFPTAIGIALMALGAVMGLSGAARAGAFTVTLEGWGRLPSAWARLAAVLVLVILYVIFCDRLGFLIAGTGLVFGLMLAFRTPVLPALVIAPVAAYAVAWSFGNLLRVPLPRGILSGLW